VADNLLEDFTKGQGFKPRTITNAQADLLGTMNAIVHHYHFGTRHALHCFMQQNGAIILGLTALLALHSGTLQPRDLDLYVPITNEEAAEEFLEESGYSICHEPNHSASEYENTSAIRISRYANGGRRIDVVYTRGSPIQAVAEFHSMLVMNYIAWYGLVCLYPALTLQKKAIINVDNERAREHHERYEARGFQLMHRHTQRLTSQSKGVDNASSAPLQSGLYLTRA